MADPVQIVVQGTPNPHAVKLTLNRTVSVEGKTYRGDPAAVDAAWAQALLGIPGVVGVYAVNNFISINKAPEAAWETIVPQAQAALTRLFAA